MPELEIVRGLPASGKTTYARAWVELDRGNRVRVNRDDIRTMVDDGVFIKGVTEQRIISIRNAMITSALNDGLSVICDDLNLPSRVVRDLIKLAVRAGADWTVTDLSDVPLDLCIERDKARQNSVGESVIRDWHTRFIKGKSYPLALPDIEDVPALVPYVPRLGTPRAVLSDVDGTVALLNGRGPYDESRVSEDLPNEPVIRQLQASHLAGNTILFTSGRTEGCREETEEWLQKHVRFPFVKPFMRKTGDQRRDAIVKLEIFDTHIRDNYNVQAVYEDRDQVVALWRSLGLACFQVNFGDF